MREIRCLLQYIYNEADISATVRGKITKKKKEKKRQVMMGKHRERRYATPEHERENEARDDGYGYGRKGVERLRSWRKGTSESAIIWSDSGTWSAP